MEKITSFLMGFLIVISLSNAQTVDWAKQGNGSDLDEGKAIAVDNNGFVYITGSFESTSLTFDNQTINNTSGTSDIFVAKFDLNGTCLWAKKIGGTGEDFGTAITVDKSTGDVYAAGYFSSSTIMFNGLPINNNGYSDLIVMKFNTAGAEQWGIGIGGNSDDEVSGISIDQSSNVYLTGFFFSNSVNFGNSSVTNNGWVDLFLAKFNSAGNNLWAVNVGGSDNDRCLAIETDAGGNSHITGLFDSPIITFGSNTITNSTGDEQLFVAKYDANGIATWSMAASSVNGGARGNGVAFDNNGNVLVTGSFDGNTLTISNTLTNANPGSYNVFAAKYNSSGIAQWATNPISGPEANEAYCIAADNSGNIYISGWYTSPSVNFGGIALNSVAAGDNIFLAKYNSSGVIQNAHSFSGIANSGGYGNAVTTDNNEDIYLTGYFEGINMIFDTDTLTNTGSWDVYWTKFGSGTASTTDNNKEHLFQISPNPFHTSATINNYKKLKNAAFVIFNSLGQIVFTQNNISSQEIIVNRGNLTKGVYFFQIINEGEIKTGKFSID